MNNSEIQKLDVTVAVCSWNAVGSIKPCLQSIKDNNVKEILLIDANSNDGTREQAAGLVDKILSDPRKGLATARNVGLNNATGSYFLSVGADNLMPLGTIKSMIDELEREVYSGVGCTTILKDPLGYFSWALNKYKIARYYPGERHVIGTPHMYRTNLLKKYMFNPVMSWSDDGDLCDRLVADGHRLTIIDKHCYEISQSSFNDIWKRWKMYGKSDWETFNKYKSEWNLKRKVKSIFYPLNKELIIPLIRTKGFINKLKISPFLLLITMRRYIGWIKYSIS